MCMYMCMFKYMYIYVYTSLPLRHQGLQRLIVECVVEQGHVGQALQMATLDAPLDLHW
jgi:hypothetical protein